TTITGACRRRSASTDDGAALAGPGVIMGAGVGAVFWATWMGMGVGGGADLTRRGVAAAGALSAWALARGWRAGVSAAETAPPAAMFQGESGWRTRTAAWSGRANTALCAKDSRCGSRDLDPREGGSGGRKDALISCAGAAGSAGRARRRGSRR